MHKMAKKWFWHKAPLELFGGPWCSCKKNKDTRFQKVIQQKLSSDIKLIPYVDETIKLDRIGEA